MLNQNKEGTIIQDKGNTNSCFVDSCTGTTFILTNQNREFYSVWPQDFQHGRPDYEHFKTPSYIGVA